MNNIRSNEAVLIKSIRRDPQQLNSRNLWRSRNSRSTIICGLMTSWDFFTSNQAVDNPLKTLLALNHLYDKLPLNDLMILKNIRLKLLITTTNLSNNIISFLFEMDLIETNEIERALDVYDWDRDIMLTDQIFQILLKFDIFTTIKFNWTL